MVLMGGVLRVRDLVWEMVVTALGRVAPCAKVIAPPTTQPSVRHYWRGKQECRK